MFYHYVWRCSSKLSFSFTLDKFFDIWTQQRRSVSPCKLSKLNFENFTIRDRLKNAKNCSQNFQVLRLQAAISNYTMITDRRKFTTKWSSTGCLVSIFTIRINSKSFSELYATYKERTSHIFGNGRCPILGRSRTPLQLPGCPHKRKVDWIGNWK